MITKEEQKKSIKRKEERESEKCIETYYQVVIDYLKGVNSHQRINIK